VPEAPDVERWGLALVLRLHQASAQLQHAVDVIVVDMADHREVDAQRFLIALELFQPRPQAALEDASGTAVDDPEALLAGIIVAKQDRVAVFRVQSLERDHAGLLDGL